MWLSVTHMMIMWLPCDSHDDHVTVCDSHDDHVTTMWLTWWLCDCHVTHMMIMWLPCDSHDDHVTAMWLTWWSCDCHVTCGVACFCRGVDDILPILTYVIIRSGLPQLVSECSIMEEFIHEGWDMYSRRDQSASVWPIRFSHNSDLIHTLYISSSLGGGHWKGRIIITII